MKLIVNKSEVKAVERYMGAIVRLNNKIASCTDVADMISTDDLKLASTASMLNAKELGIDVKFCKNTIVIDIPEEFVALYMDMLADVVNDTSDQITCAINYIDKYSNVVNKALGFLGALDIFNGPIAEGKMIFNSLKKAFRLSSEKQLIKVENYVERITKG